MPAPLIWTPERDEQLRAMKAGASTTWDAMALALGCCRAAAIERGKVLGIWTANRGGASCIAALPREDLDRPAHPAGHADTWALLLALTPSLPPDTPYIPPQF